MRITTRTTITAATTAAAASLLLELTGCQCTRGPAPKVAARVPAGSVKTVSPQSGAEPTHDVPSDSVHSGVHSNDHASGQMDPHAQPQEQAPMDDHHVFAGGLTWKAPEVFKRQQPKSNMRAAEYAVSGASGESATLAVYFFGPDQGGQAEDNIKRWTEQFSPEARKVSRFTKRVGKLVTQGVEINGTYLGMAMPGEAAAAPAPSNTLLAVIVDGPQGPVFFKWVGPSKVVQENKQHFDELVASIHTL